MSGGKPNDFGQTPFYEVGDRVKVWPIFKNPIGTIEAIVDADSFPIKYRVRYQYHDGTYYTEVFEQVDLTLIERRNTFYCNCKTASDRHASWCNRYNGSKW